jgi:hypothetical protein
MLAAPDPNRPDAMSALPDATSFLVAESGFGKSGVYKAYSHGGALHFAWVAPKLAQDSAGGYRFAFGLIGLLIHSLVVKPALRRQAELEAQYDTLEPGSPQFMGKDQRNFSVRPHDVRAAKLKKGNFLTRGPKQVGTLELQTNDGASRQWRIFSSMTGMQIERAIRAALPNVEGSLT